MQARIDRRLHVLIFGLVLGCAPAANGPPQDQSSQRKSPPIAKRPRVDQPSASPFPQKLDKAHLPNAVRLHEKVISGGLPEGEAGFGELRTLGVQTIISVDGARPNVEAARRFGLRYVHLPHGYDGISDERARELAKAVRDLPGPIYLHCHHGKHRSPAAAAVACVGAGLIPPEVGRAALALAGTGENYRGLHQAADSARRFEDSLLDSLRVELPEAARLPPLAETMVGIEQRHDRLKKLLSESANATSGFDPRPVRHETLLLRELFTELLRTDDAARKPPRFRELLKEAEAAAIELEQVLGAEKSAAATKGASASAGVMMRIAANCRACHQEFRDVPQAAANSGNAGEAK